MDFCLRSLFIRPCWVSNTLIKSQIITARLHRKNGPAIGKINREKIFKHIGRPTGGLTGVFRKMFAKLAILCFVSKILLLED
jgi:hypothetical protein